MRRIVRLIAVSEISKVFVELIQQLVATRFFPSLGVPLLSMSSFRIHILVSRAFLRLRQAFDYSVNGVGLVLEHLLVLGLGLLLIGFLAVVRLTAFVSFTSRSVLEHVDVPRLKPPCNYKPCLLLFSCEFVLSVL